MEDNTRREDKASQQLGECVTCRDYPPKRVCWHGLPMWSVVHYVPATKCWIDLHGHIHRGHTIIPLPGTRLEVTILPELEVTA
jgi:hypothetical protein